MKKLVTTMALFVVATATTIASFCIEPKGEVLGRINQLEADGFSLVSIDCQQIYYLVEPTPPYVNRIITVRMSQLECFDNGLCAITGRAAFTADEVVVNNNGTTIQTNVSDIIVAL